MQIGKYGIVYILFSLRFKLLEIPWIGCEQD